MISRCYSNAVIIPIYRLLDLCGRNILTLERLIGYMLITRKKLFVKILRLFRSLVLPPVQTTTPLLPALGQPVLCRQVWDAARDTSS